MQNHHIKKLDKLTIAKIAAGEVIDRPVSIVKELIENSIDAGSTHITIELRRGGLELIRVTDDGCGIAADDLPLALEDHATSKIASVDDLFQISSMGFRGEALASIRHVAELSIISRSPVDVVGTQILAVGGRVDPPKAIAHANGTSIEVRDLFRNIPVRQKFLKSPATEFSLVQDLIQATALLNPDIEFKLIHDNKESLNTLGAKQVPDRMVTFWGRELRNSVISVDLSIAGYRLHGYISQPTRTFSSRSKQVLGVNGRWIKSPILIKALGQAVADVVPNGRFLATVLKLEVPPGQVDVNIHPQKLDVRFANTGFVFDIIMKGVRNGLSGADSRILGLNIATQSLQSPGSMSQGVYKDHSAHTDVLFKAIEWGRMQPAVAGFENGPKTTVPFLQLFDTYIVVNSGDALVVLDQHAVHERILYEKIKQNSVQSTYTQPLLAAEVFTLTPDRLARFWELEAVFSALGFKFEDFGTGQLVVREVPVSMAGPTAERLLIAFIDENIDIHSAIWDQLLVDKDKLQRMACRAAIKAGKKMAQEEVVAMIQDLIKTPSNYTCPHGRPLFVTLKKTDLERMFLRS